MTTEEKFEQTTTIILENLRRVKEFKSEIELKKLMLILIIERDNYDPIKLELEFKYIDDKNEIHEVSINKEQFTLSDWDTLHDLSPANVTYNKIKKYYLNSIPTGTISASLF